MSITTTSLNILNKYPKCVREVFTLMKNFDRPVKVTDLHRLSKYSDRSVRRALVLLFELDLVMKLPDLDDLRSHYLTLSESYRG